MSFRIRILHSNGKKIRYLNAATINIIMNDAKSANVRAGAVICGFVHQTRALFTVTTPVITTNDCVMSDRARNLWHLLAWSNFPDHSFHAFLEFVVLGGVDERIDTAVGEHQDHGEVVQPASEVERVTQKVDKVQQLVQRPACEKTAAYDQRRDQCVAPSFA